MNEVNKLMKKSKLESPDDNLFGLPNIFELEQNI
jgi:hypothetical protein